MRTLPYCSIPFWDYRSSSLLENLNRNFFIGNLEKGAQYGEDPNAAFRSPIRHISSRFVYCHAKTYTHVVVSCPYSYPLLFTFSHALILKGSY